MTRFRRRVAALRLLRRARPGRGRRRRQDRHLDERVDVRLPAGHGAGPEVQRAASNVGFRIFQGGSDIGINDVAHGRVTIGNASRDPEPGIDPHGLTFTKIARDGVCVITNSEQPRARTCPEPGAGDLRRQRHELGDRAGRSGARRDRPDHPHRRIRHRRRVPADLHGRDAPERTGSPGTAVAKQSNGLVQQPVALGSQRDRVRVARLHPAARIRSPTRASRARCATPRVVSTRACATSG